MFICPDCKAVIELMGAFPLRFHGRKSFITLELQLTGLFVLTTQRDFKLSVSRDKTIPDELNVCLAHIFSNYTVYNKYVKQIRRAPTLLPAKEPQGNKKRRNAAFPVYHRRNMPAAITRKYKPPSQLNRTRRRIFMLDSD